MLSPYYEQDGITIYHGDAREVVFEIPRWDVVITDPPYGIQLGSGQGTGHGHGLIREPYATYDDSPDNFRAVVVPVLHATLLRATRAAVFMGFTQHREMPPGAVLGGVYTPAAVARHSWGFNCLAPILFYGNAPNMQHGAKSAILRSTATAEKNGHPCPKPLAWMRWLMGLATLPGDRVLDPFMGSGTTLVAAQYFHLPAVGIEIEERYCEIAARQLSQQMLPLEVSC